MWSLSVQIWRRFAPASESGDALRRRPNLTTLCAI